VLLKDLVMEKEEGEEKVNKVEAVKRDATTGAK
jgi:hypothetical protein